MHTSTVTVAIIKANEKINPLYQKRDEADFYVEWFSGSGAGGQHRNKHQNSCRLYHLPTGLVETRQGRSRVSNLKEAKTALIQTLDKQSQAQDASVIASDRKKQVGCGARGDKSVTIRFQDDMATHHENNTRTTAKRYMKGFMDDLWLD